MENHSYGPKTILHKHIDLDPKMTIVVSVHSNDVYTIDISHPVNIAQVALLSKFLENHLDRFIFQKAEVPPVIEGEFA